MIYIVSCGKEKLSHPAQAKDLYQGNYFKACWKYAYELSDYDFDKIRIISAKYGLVRPDEIIEPYDVVISDSNSITIEQVREQVDFNEQVTILGGKKYVKFLRQIFPTALAPLSGGMLSQIAWLHNEANKHKDLKQYKLFMGETKK